MENNQKGFTFKEHQKIGKEIHKLRQKIRTLNQKMVDAYGRTSRAAGLTERIFKDLGLLQKELNARMCQENPGSSKLELLACYYPEKK